MINTRAVAVAEAHFVVIMKAVTLAQLTAVITVCVSISLACFLLSLSPPFFSLGDGGNEQNIPLIGTVWSFSVFW